MYMFTKSKDPFPLLSEYRGEIMGLSTIFIILYHSLVWQYVPDCSKYILRFSFVGVEMFLFLSGLGLCYSFEKNANLQKYYCKRLTRIYPSYIIVIILIMFFNPFGLAESILLLTGVGYYLSPIIGCFGGYFWYVSVILCLYALFPFIYINLKRCSIIQNILILLLVLVFPYVIHFTFTDYYDYGSARIFSFVLPIMLWQKKKELKVTDTCLMAVAFMAFIVLNLYSLIAIDNSHKTLVQFTFLGFVAPGLCVFSAHLFDKLASLKTLQKLFKSIGLVSLELYMVHLAVHRYVLSSPPPVISCCFVVCLCHYIYYLQTY